MSRMVYDWCCELGDNPTQYHNWFVDSIQCENCFHHIKYGYKYCPKCGELIEGIKNPEPPIKEK